MINDNTFLTSEEVKLVKELKIQYLIKHILERAFNILFAGKLTEFLEYDKYEIKGYNSDNSYNGYRIRK